MTLNYHDIQEARDAAVEDIRKADIATRNAANLAAGRLKIANVSHSTLAALKKELKNYNIQTGEWK